MKKTGESEMYAEKAHAPEGGRVAADAMGGYADGKDNALKKRARLRCMHLLEKRDYTEKQLRDKLRMGRTDYPPEVIDDAISYVKGYRYVDDARYALRYVECMKETKSRRQIAQSLAQKGVARELIRAAFEQTEAVPEEELILKWMEKRHYSAATADQKERRRMYVFLAGKGFSVGSILKMLRIEEPEMPSL